MAKNDYCLQNVKDEKKIARSMAMAMDISPKHAREVCEEIKGMTIPRAKQFLENVMAKEEFVTMRVHKKQLPHRVGGVQGRYPVKAAGKILKILENAEANAEHKGMETETMHIIHAASNRGPTYKRHKPRGRMKASNIDTTHVEIAVGR